MSQTSNNDSKVKEAEIVEFVNETKSNKIPSILNESDIASAPISSSIEIIKALQPQISLVPSPTHRFHIVNQAKVLFNYFVNLKTWQFEQQIDSISISKLPLPDLELPFIRGDGIIHGGHSVEEIMAVIVNENSRKQCLNC